ncbi:MAG: site-specific integrase [Crocinitomicaceae bacterium]|nr:site-specific integrase [Crocinitomicaceae bacterium]MBK8924976.1 site-specific integrase [Crocinitomicaceae bacterium]
MKLNYTFNILFWLYKAKMKNNLCPIYLRITIDGKRTEISTKKWVAIDKWNNSSQCAKGNGDEAREINQYLNLMKGDIEKIYLRITTDDRIPNPDEIKKLLLGEDPKPVVTYKTIIEAFDYHYLKMSELVKIGKVVDKTLLRYKITKNKLKEFIQFKFGVDDKPLPELRLSFVSEFEHFLLTKHKLQNNTAHKYIKNLKKIMNMAVGLDWIPSNPFNQFRCSYHNPTREILTQEELNVIMSKEITTPRLAEVRDVFVFCCYTGFAYIDVYKFEKDSVLKGIDGEYWLSINRQKTGTKESVPLLPIPLLIIEKYKEHEYCNSHNKLLPVNSNQRYNAYLKELADICGIKKHLTTHTARHTFATTVTLANGVPIETVSSMLGHKEIRTTQIYAKVIEKKVSEDMKSLRAKISPQLSEIQEMKTGS